VQHGQSLRAGLLLQRDVNSLVDGAKIGRITTVEASRGPGSIRLRSDLGVRVGALLVVLSGCVLFVATFLPWTSFNALYVNGGQGVRSFSGWDLTTDCTTRAFPGQCVFEEHSLSPEFVPLRVVAGDWALLIGASLTIIGLLVFRQRPGRLFGVLLALGWIVALAGLGCGIVTILDFIKRPNGPEGTTIEIGAAIAAVSPAVALVGMAVVQTACANRSTNSKGHPFTRTV
jgi:hypothetical protein